MASRSFYSGLIRDFLKTDDDMIFAEMVRANPFDLNDLQRNSWLEEITILKRELSGFAEGYILLEFMIPRMGKRVDIESLLLFIVFGICPLSWA